MKQFARPEQASRKYFYFFIGLISLVVMTGLAGGVRSVDSKRSAAEVKEKEPRELEKALFVDRLVIPPRCATFTPLLDSAAGRRFGSVNGTVNHVVTNATAPGPNGSITTLILNPANGALGGHPSQVVGWGFEIVNDTYWVVEVSTGFCSSFNPSTGFIPCSNPVPHGTYSDFNVYNFVLSAPGVADTSQQNFTQTLPCSTPGNCLGTHSPTTIIACGRLVLASLSGRKRPRDIPIT